ncbi:hypothetical protein BJV78DRAFT_1158239 [Lactifluus subvellereus]|nr:hypothetical protein BJV78DRAFT_1158239 [Lactifluus subvellereus]
MFPWTLTEGDEGEAEWGKSALCEPRCRMYSAAAKTRPTMSLSRGSHDMKTTFRERVPSSNRITKQPRERSGSVGMTWHVNSGYCTDTLRLESRSAVARGGGLISLPSQASDWSVMVPSTEYGLSSVLLPSCLLPSSLKASDEILLKFSVKDGALPHLYDVILINPLASVVYQLYFHLCGLYQTKFSAANASIDHNATHKRAAITTKHVKGVKGCELCDMGGMRVIVIQRFCVTVASVVIPGPRGAEAMIWKNRPRPRKGQADPAITSTCVSFGQGQGREADHWSRTLGPNASIREVPFVVLALGVELARDLTSQAPATAYSSSTQQTIAFYRHSEIGWVPESKNFQPTCRLKSLAAAAPFLNPPALYLPLAQP